MSVKFKISETSYAQLPKGFEARADGIWRKVSKEDSQDGWQWLCSHLRVLSMTRDRVGTGWGRLVEVIDPDGNAHRWSIPARMFAGDGSEVRAGLLDRGLMPAPGQGARQALMDLLQRWQTSSRSVTAERLGWVNEDCTAFICGNGSVIGANDVVFQQGNVLTAATEMRPSGTLDDWRRTVAAPCAGNVLMVVGVSLAFSGPMHELLGMDGGGLHLRGASSQGKSTIQRVASSVWGSPRFMHSWRATANGLEGVAAACNSSIVVLDELGEISGREAGQAAYMLANGVGKSRADRSGSARSPLNWRVPVLSSGELTLADKVSEAGGRAAAGQAVRLLDVVADSRAYGAFDELHDSADGAAFVDRLREATATHYGTAGPAFVEALIHDRDAAIALAREFMAEFRDNSRHRFGLSDEGQTYRATSRLGLLAAAGEIATAWNLTSWQPGEAMGAALEVLGLWLDGRGGCQSAEARDGIERVRAFIVAYGDSRFESVGEGVGPRHLINRAGWHREGTFYIGADAWREIHKGADPSRAARHLCDAGLLVRGDGKNLAQKAPHGIPGRPRVYAVTKEIMGAGDE